MREIRGNNITIQSELLPPGDMLKVQTMWLFDSDGGCDMVLEVGRDGHWYEVDYYGTHAKNPSSPAQREVRLPAHAE